MLLDSKNGNNKESGITLQLGPSSNLLAAHLWNIRQNECNNNFEFFQSNIGDETSLIYPRTVVVDFDENIPSFVLEDEYSDENSWNSIWTGPISTYNLVTSSNNIVNLSGLRRQPNSLKWMNVLQLDLHKNSTIPLPRWTNTDVFDSFHSGSVGSSCSTVSTAFVESITDKVRLFAEACDRLASISVFSDLTGGFGGLCSSLLSEIRDDFGHHVMIPVWAMRQTQRAEDCTDLKSLVQRLDVPLSYASITENANLFLPITASSQNLSGTFGTVADAEREALSYLTLAMAVECSGSFMGGNIATTATSVVEWCADASGGGRWPVGMLEGFFTKEMSSALSFKSKVQAACERYTCFNSDEHREHNSSNISECSLAENFQLNPFMESFSAMRFESGSNHGRYLKPFTNLVHIRSDTDSAGLNCRFPFPQ